MMRIFAKNIRNFFETLTVIDFSNNLSNRLRTALPGKEAQKIMMPKAGSVIDRFSIEVKKGAKEGAVLILLYKKNGKIYFPLTQRHEYDGVHSGQISFPGGKVEDSDGTVEKAALRETEEEIGISHSSVNILGRLTDLFIIVSNFNVRPVIGFVDEPPSFKVDPHEVAKVIEISTDQLKDSTLVKEKEVITKGGFRIMAPYFDFDGHHVWGATAMMLSELKEILKSL
jgi:8-oxo-dGTP pyrophosphatase MutT (NUDIX family)